MRYTYRYTALVSSQASAENTGLWNVEQLLHIRVPGLTHGALHHTPHSTPQTVSDLCHRQLDTLRRRVTLRSLSAAQLEHRRKLFELDLPVAVDVSRQHHLPREVRSLGASSRSASE